MSARQDEATPDLSQAHSQAEPTGQSLQVIERTSIERLATRVTARLPLRRVGRAECELGTIEGEEPDMYGANSIHKARDLSPDLRRAAEALLGRNLQEDESISVRAFKDTVKEAPTGEARAEAFRRLRARIEQTAARAPGVPEADIDALIDEAVDHVRHHRG